MKLPHYLHTIKVFVDEKSIPRASYTGDAAGLYEIT